MIDYLRAGFLKNAVPVALAWLLLIIANLGIRLENCRSVLLMGPQDMLHRKE